MIKLSAEIISNGVAYEIKNLLDISFNGQDRSDAAKPCWGIKSNSGRVEFRDDKNLINELKYNGNLSTSRINIELTVYDRKVSLGDFKVTNAYKNPQGDLTILEFEDYLITWQNVQMKRYYCPYDQDVSIKDIIDAIISRADEYIEYANFTTENRLKNYYIAFPLIEEGSLWSQMKKICEVSSCYIYCDHRGVPNIYYGGDT